MQLTSETKAKLEERVRQTRNVHERLRLCVVLARSEGMSHEAIAQAHRISVQSVYRYLAEYESETKTQHDARGGSTSKLDKLQTEELIEHLQKTTYLYVKEICKYVKTKYTIDYTRSGMTLWVKEHGFVYKQPVKIPGKLDPQKQESFIKEYETLKASLAEDEELYFLDAVHPEFQSKAVCGWIRTGETKTLPTTSAQYRMHFVGALALKDMKVFVREYETVDAESVIKFFQELEQSSQASTIHIICDNGRSNKNKKVQEYLRNSSKIKVHYLPAYSPNLNPIERLWKVLRETKTYNKCYEKFSDFKSEINNFFFEDIPKMKNELLQRINDNFQRICINNLVLAAT